MNKHFSLSLQTGLTIFFGVSFMMSIFFWYQYEERKKDLVLEQELETMEHTRLIASAINSQVHHQDAFGVWKQMRQLHALLLTGTIAVKEYAVVDRNNLILTHSDPMAHPVMQKVDVPQNGLYWHKDTLKVVHDVPHPTDGRKVGQIILTFDTSSIHDELRAYLQEIIFSFFLLLLISIALAIGISLRVSRPIKKLGDFASRIGSGELDISDFSNKPLEIMRLAESIQSADRSIANHSRELADSEALLRSIVDNSPAVITVKDLDGKYILVNRCFEELFDLAPGSAIGKKVNEILHSSHAEMINEHDQKVVQDGKELMFDEVLPLKGSNRSYYSLRFPIRNIDGDIEYLCGLSTDITRQKKDSEQIAKLATVVNQATELILITDTNGCIEYVNPAFEQTSGYSIKEAIGKLPSIVKSGLHTGTYYATMWNALRQGKPWHGDFTNLNKQGEPYEVTQSISPIKDVRNNITGYVAVQRDVTSERQMQRKFQHADRVESLGVLAGGIAHDFNNLLTAILGNVSLALVSGSDQSNLDKYLNAIQQASLSAADLCRQMLAYSGKGKFVVENVNLSELVKNMGKLIHVSLPKSIITHYDLSQQLPLIEADVAQIQQIVLNLITNASEAIEDKSGTISITTGVTMVD